MEFSHEAGRWDVYEIECPCGISVYGPCGHAGEAAKNATVRKWNKRTAMRAVSQEGREGDAALVRRLYALHARGLSYASSVPAVNLLLSALAEGLKDAAERLTPRKADAPSTAPKETE
jgi:hypothetical protein